MTEEECEEVVEEECEEGEREECSTVQQQQCITVTDTVCQPTSQQAVRLTSLSHHWSDRTRWFADRFRHQLATLQPGVPDGERGGVQAGAGGAMHLHTGAAVQHCCRGGLYCTVLCVRL